MKKFQVTIDIQVSKTFHDVEAESEEQAEQIVKEMFAKEPYYYIRSADTYSDMAVYDVYEQEES